MSIKQTLTTAAICALALQFNASANVVYDNEVFSEWFSVTAANANLADATKWTKPADGEATSDASGIKLDTDLTDPLTYKPANQSTNVAIVSACFEATANASEPVLTDAPQAALTVVVDGAATNWCGLVGGDGQDPSWVKFVSPVPVVGTQYNIKIEFDLQSTEKKIRYSVGDTVLGTGWYPNPKTSAGDHITSVSFAGTGDIGDFGGSNVVAAAAGFNGVNYTTFEAALDAAKPTWKSAGTTPVVLYKDAGYSASATETIYVNANTHTFTITGSVAVDQNGNEYSIKASGDCEAKIGDKYYSTIENAIAAATAGQTIVVNKDITKALTFNTTSVTLDTNNKTVTCAMLTVADGVTLTLANALVVTNADIAGTVAGSAALTVNGTLTGVAVANLVFGDSATFAYAGTKLAPTTLTMGTSLTITGLGEAAIGTEVITATGLDVSKISATLPEGRCFEVIDNTLTVVKEILATITASSEAEGYDYTNGTVSVTANVKSGKTATAVLTVTGWDGTTKKVVAEKPMTSGAALTWDVAAAMEGALVQGGAYTYTVKVMVDNKVAAVKSGEFTAAKWGADGAWFKADASTGSSVVNGGAWAGEMTIDDDNKYEVSDSRFNVTSEAGSNKFTRVDTKIAFESLIDDMPDNPDGNTVGGFVATTQGWMAFNGTEWVLLAGADAPTPVAGQDYVIRTEFDFAATPKSMRFFVAEGEGDFFPLAESGSQWISTGVAEQETLKAVEFQGSGKLESIMATVANAALARVGDVEYDSMAEAFAAAGTEGTNTITLLTNASVAPTTPGFYEIDPSGHEYVSGGKVSREKKTVAYGGSGEPVVRPSNEIMKQVKTPGGASYRDTNKLRLFLERNEVAAYTNDVTSAEAIMAAMNATGGNTLPLWQDYALGIDKTTSIAPVTTPAGDTDKSNITLSIPAINPDNYSEDYDISYTVNGSSAGDKAPQSISVPLDTGTYTIKAVFTPKAAPTSAK